MNWKQILKKNLNVTERSKSFLTVIDYNKHKKLMELTESIQPFNHESLLIATSLQGHEKMSGYKNEYQTNFTNCPFDFESFNEKYSITFFKEKQTWTRIEINRYSIINPKTGKENYINYIEQQGFTFQIININSKGKKVIYESNLISPLEKLSGNVYYKSRYNIYLQDINKNLCNFIKSNDKLIFNYTINNIKNSISVKLSKESKICCSILPAHFEKIYHKNEYQYITNFKLKGIFEHCKYYYNNSFPKNIIYNLTNSIRPEIIYQEAKFFLNLPNDKNLYIEVKDQCIDKNKKFHTQVNGSIFEHFIQFNVIDISDNGIPLVWKMKYKDIIYYLKPIFDKGVYSISNNIIEKIYFVPLHIILRETNLNLDDKEIGIGWVQYNNFDKEINVINKKLKKLFQPLERPNTKMFTSCQLPIDSVIPSVILLILFLFIIIFIIIITVLYILQQFYGYIPLS